VWLLRGMRPDGILTTVDVEPEHQGAAREAFTEAGVAANRTRVIAGRALEVLPRLTDGVYDLVFCDGDKNEYADYLEQALRLLRPGGVVAFDNALWGDRVADPAQRDQTTVAIRELGKSMRADERLVPCLLPVGDGLLCAVKPAGRD
jgi:predicted O-methyltransferase YrrM